MYQTLLVVAARAVLTLLYTCSFTGVLHNSIAQYSCETICVQQRLVRFGTFVFWGPSLFIGWRHFQKELCDWVYRRWVLWSLCVTVVHGDTNSYLKDHKGVLYYYVYFNVPNKSVSSVKVSYNHFTFYLYCFTAPYSINIS